MIELVKNKSHQVVKRDGRIEDYSEEKLKAVILWACDGKEAFANEILQDLNLKIHDQIRIVKLYDTLIETVANKINAMYPQYDIIARNLYLQKIYKSLWDIKRTDGNYPEYSEVLKKGIHLKLYSKEVIDSFSDDEILTLGKMIDSSKDYKFDYLGLNIFMDKYSLGGFELPQHGFMRLAIFAFWKEPRSVRLSLIQQRYNDLSNFVFSEATPKWINSLRDNAQMASCVVATVGDDSKTINKTISNLGLFSKYGGGLALDISSLRSTGSKISTTGKSSGPIPFVKMLESTVMAYNQNGVRKGACAVYYNWWHYDVRELLQLKDEGGVEDLRARNLQYGFKINRLLLERFRKDEDITLFDPKDTPGLLDTYGDLFDEAYEFYENKVGVRRKTMKARDLMFELVNQMVNTGNIYLFFTENVHEQTPFNETIYSSNLCVTGDTKILTKDYGYIPIEQVAGQTLECWNGEEWSMTPLFKTSEGQKVLTVVLSNGVEIRATPYHKWVVMDGYSKMVTKRTFELLPEDKLIKFNLEPVTHGTKILQKAYENGFYTGDGCTLANGRGRIYLYNNKQALLPRFNEYTNISYSDTRISIEYPKNVLQDKFFIPDSSYSVSSRLAWLSGLLDADGTLTNNNGTESIQLSSINREFLQGVLLLLQELGTYSSISKLADAGYRLMPANDGTGEYKEYWCKEAYRLMIPGSSLSVLLDLGLVTSRVVPTYRAYQRAATQFTKVISVNDYDEIEATYCGTEPKRNLLMFNGVLTANCNEIYLPTKPVEFKDSTLTQTYGSTELVSEETYSPGMIALCNLSSINLVVWSTLSPEEKARTSYNLLRASDNLIDYAYYPVNEGKVSNMRYRSIGVGMSNLAQLLALHATKFSDSNAGVIMQDFTEDIYYYLTEASIQLAKERGAFEGYHDTKWKTGWLPMDGSKMLLYPLKHDWNKLREAIKCSGLRFATLGAVAPTATSSLMLSATEGVQPVKNLVSDKTGNYSCKQIVPNITKLRPYYEVAWNVPNDKLLRLAATRQAFIDQGQSTDTFYKDISSASEIMDNILYAESLGLKGMYYMNQLKIEDIEHCDSCSS